MCDCGKISATKPDWNREKITTWWSPNKQLLKSVRSYQRIVTKKSMLSKLKARIYVLKHRFWSMVTGADIPLSCNIDGGLLIPHPNGIVIHPRSKIGPNCLIFQQVTIGSVENARHLPIIGGHVDIGAGAKVLGAVVIGNHAKIGANAVVLCDIPEGKTAVGIPARII